MRGFRLGRPGFGHRPPIPVHFRRYQHGPSRPGSVGSWTGGAPASAGSQSRLVGLGVVGAAAGAIVALSAPVLGLAIAAAGCAVSVAAFAARRSRFERALRQAADLLSAGKPREARDRLLPFVRHYRENQALLRWLGLAYSRSGQSELAEQTLREMHERARTSTSAQVYADQLRLDGKVRDAIEVLESVKPGDDRAAAHATMLGNCFLELGDIQAAIDAFKRGPILRRKLDGDLMALHLALGGAYEEADNRTGALREYRRVAATDLHYEDVEARIRRLMPPDEEGARAP